MGNKHIQNTKKLFAKLNRRSNIIKCAIFGEHDTFKGPFTMFDVQLCYEHDNNIQLSPLTFRMP
jgi:hypothetical protein